MAVSIIADFTKRDKYIASQKSNGIPEGPFRESQCAAMVSFIATSSNVTYEVATEVGDALAMQGIGDPLLVLTFPAFM